MSNGIPQEYVGTVVAVILYTHLCLLATLVLLRKLYLNGDKFTFVSLLTLFVSIGIVGAICEQIHYAANWKVVKEAQYQKALYMVDHPGLVFTNAAGWGGRTFYSIPLLILFWSIALFAGTWNLSLNKLRGHQDQISLGSKIFAIVLPAIHQGIRQIPALYASAITYLFITDSIIITSFTIGTIFLILTLYKYIQSRKVFKLFQASSAHSASMTAGGTTTSTSNAAPVSTRLDADDKWLIIRFTIAFSVLTAYSIILGMHQHRLYREHKATDLADGPNVSPAFIKYECVQDIPVVTNGFVMLLIFGTRRLFWQGYWKKCKEICGGARQRLKSLGRRKNRAGRREELPMHWNRMHSEDDCVELSWRGDKGEPSQHIKAVAG
ncbi:hypothetical protein H2201_003191 [Coniosporium apollinis]|uniref:Uncharacterized protein n=1 Tax=Coniosporium apollinis TaxID=61459 RepID=A0ABQ9P340_9PEZI|nr:hypothetical protein H2201_003191 [Coniosporium apollinis]